MAESQLPVLEWSPVAGATSYTLEVSEQTDFARSVIFTGLTGHSQRVHGMNANTVYHWRVRSLNDVAQSPRSGLFQFTTPMDTSTGIERQDADVPTVFELAPNYPNPFNPSTTIRFGLPEAATVRLSIFDAMGRLVEDLLNSPLAPGQFEVSWEAGTRPSGTYFYRLQANDRVLTGKMLLIK